MNTPIATQLEELVSYMASKISVPTIGIGGGYAPIGTIISYMGTTAPQDYLACDGSTKNIADYPQLAEFFAAQFGSANFFGGNGTTTFAVPDLQGEFLRGTGTNSHTGQGDGANVGTHQDATKMPIMWSDTGSAGMGTGSVSNEDSKVSVSGYRSLTSTAQTGTIYTITTRPTNTSILYCIKAVVAGEVYSTEEREAGTWVGGEKIYQKTIDCGALPNATYKDIPSGLSNITIVNMYGMSKATSDGAMIPIPRSNNGDNTDVDISYRNDNKIRLVTRLDLSVFDWTYVTLLYIKTTT